ncbi:MAG: TonB-dependent receptor [Rhodocyclaceae bacterium]|nr:TonB-dependent receptor [Rhodocyclaceae bacterium]
MGNKCRATLRVLPALIAAAYAGNALAQEKIEEVIITAQKRQERLQDVPLAVTAISGAQLETRGIEGAKDLSSLAPTLMVTYGNSGNTSMSIISIRGTGSGAPSIFLDTAVGTYVDGVFTGKNQGGLFDIVDLERVEILRGPQGTLFGRNTLSGAINFITKKPSGVFGGSVGVDIGNHGALIQRFAVDLPSMGPLKLSVAARDENRDGYMKNHNGKDNGQVDKQTYRIAATLDATRDFQATYVYDHTDLDNTPLPVTLYTPYGWRGNITTTTNTSALGYPFRAAIAAGASTSYPSSRNSTPGINQWERMKTDNHALTLTYALNPNNTLKYIFADRSMRWGDSLDLDGIPAPIYAYTRKTTLDTKSHELQWVGNVGRLKYVAGYYKYEEDNYTANPQVISGALNFTNNFGGSVDSKAFFGQLDYDFTDKWSGSLGVRRSEDTKGVDSSRYGTVGYLGAMTPAGLPALINLGAAGLQPVSTSLGDILQPLGGGAVLDLSKQPTGATTVAMASAFDARAKKTFTATTPAASLTYKFNEGLNVYGRVAKGYRSGGFPAEAAGGNTAQVTSARTTPFKPEKSTTIELGFKSTFMDGRAQLNGAIYQNKIDDMQTQRMVPGTTSSITVNAGKVTNQGFELEGQMVVADGWKVGANWGYVDVEIDKWMDIGLNNGGLPVDTAGNRVPSYAPKNTFNVNVDGRLAKTAWGTLRIAADVSYTDQMYNVPCIKDLTAANAGGTYYAPYCKVPARTLGNARLTLAGVPVGGPGRADIALWVRNIGNVRKPVNYIDMDYFRVATWTEPRMYGLSLSYKW